MSKSPSPADCSLRREYQPWQPQADELSRMEYTQGSELSLLLQHGEIHRLLQDILHSLGEGCRWFSHDSNLKKNHEINYLSIYIYIYNLLVCLFVLNKRKKS